MVGERLLCQRQDAPQMSFSSNVFCKTWFLRALRGTIAKNSPVGNYVSETGQVKQMTLYRSTCYVAFTFAPVNLQEAHGALWGLT